MILVIAFLASLIPSLALFFCLRNIKKEDSEYKKICNKAFLYGLLSVFPILLVSGIFALIESQSGLKNMNYIVDQVFHDFIVLALAEELVKFFAAKKILKEFQYNYSWMDIIAVGTIVGLAFGLAEDIPYAISAGVEMMILRGICAGHAVYAFVAMYFYGKGLKENDNKLMYSGCLVSWLFHGVYDFCLTPEFIDYTGFISLLIAFLEFITLIFIFVFIFKKGRKEKYTEPLNVEIR